MRVAVVAAAALAAMLAACGGGDPPPLPASCSEGPDAVLRALAKAPAPVRLRDGTQLSDCVQRAFDDGELQLLGLTLTPAADRLAERADQRAALELGYLIGAVRRGAARTNGIHLELVRRLEGTVTYSGPALLATTRRGIASGRAGG